MAQLGAGIVLPFAPGHPLPAVGLVLRLVGMVLKWMSTAWLTMNFLVMLEIHLGPCRGKVGYPFFGLYPPFLFPPCGWSTCTYFLVNGFFQRNNLTKSGNWWL